MISVRIPKEIKAYKEKIWLGMTIRQLSAVVVALIICVPFYLRAIKFLNEELVSWIVIFIALPCAGVGFFSFNGLNFEKFIVAIFKSEFLYPKKRVYKIENNFMIWQNKFDLEEFKGLKKGTRSYKRKCHKASLERAFLIENEMIIKGVNCE